MKPVASAPAKITLLGEHFFVYDEPTIVLAMNKREYVSVTSRKDKYTSMAWEKKVDVHLTKSVNLQLIVGNTGILRSTIEPVSKVRDLVTNYPKISNSIIKAWGKRVKRGLGTIRESNIKKLGELMNMNHGLLYAIGVSNSTLNLTVSATGEACALGAKLTGQEEVAW